MSNFSILNRLKEIYDYIKSKTKDIEHIEIFMSKSSEEEYSIRAKDLDKYTFAESIGIGIRLIKDGFVGSSFTEKLENSKDLDNLVNNAKNSMKYSISEPFNIITEKDEDFNKSYNMINKDIISISNDKLKNIGLDIEETLYSLDKRISNVPSAGLGRYTFSKAIINSNGICKEEIKNSISYFAEVIAKENDIIKTGFDVYTSLDSKFNIKEFCNNIVENATSKLSARKIESGKYRTVFLNKAMRSILGGYLGLFSAENVQKNLSLFRDKLNKKVANEFITIKDIALLNNGLANTNFDGEGVRTKDLTIIENGILKNFLYNNYTAKKDNIESTGHASRGFKSPIGISSHNFFVDSKNKTNLDSLILEVKNGIFVTSLTGLHAGINFISGDFSLQAEGIKIENGKLSYTANPFIVSGNILNLLTDIEMFADDIDYNKSSIYCPSALIKELSFAS